MTTRTTRPTRNRAIPVPRACASFRHAENVLGRPVGSRRRCCRYSRSNSQGITTTTQLLPLGSPLRVAHNRSRFRDGLTSSAFSEHGGYALTATGRGACHNRSSLAANGGRFQPISTWPRRCDRARRRCRCTAAIMEREPLCNQPRDDAQRDGPASASGGMASRHCGAATDRQSGHSAAARRLNQLHGDLVRCRDTRRDSPARHCDHRQQSVIAPD